MLAGSSTRRCRDLLVRSNVAAYDALSQATAHTDDRPELRYRNLRHGGTSTVEFTTDAKQFETKIVLIRLEELAQLMIDLGIGVERVASCRVYRADADSFANE